MTVAELIEKLKAVDQGALVVKTDPEEGRIFRAEEIEIRKVRLLPPSTLRVPYRMKPGASDEYADWTTPEDADLPITAVELSW